MSDETRRVFFALWPDSAIRQAIVERREHLGRIGRRRVPDANLHMTLLFLGDQPADRMEAALEAAGEVRGERCRLRLDRFGWFPRAGVVWLGGEAPDALRDLRERLCRAMSDIGIEFDRRPFRPHVTLFRKVRRRPELPAPEPLDWPVRDFVLVESTPGRPYQVLRTWSLQSET